MKVPQISLVIFICTSIKSTKGITLSTNLGKLIGNDILVPGVGTVYTFLNIPYAKPPVGDLRLRKPQPYGTWQSTLNATSYGPSCMQPQYGITDVAANREMSEDCLHLNIFVPNTVNTTANKSVMIWIHGGAYTIGQSNAFDGTSLSLNGDVILVTINYRLGFFGFFGTGKPDSPGNYGLWDQHLAIKWVHDNIASFGGDPQSVTIFGESAGGGSVSFQSFFPGNRGLFQKVVSQSGVALSDFLRLQQSTLDRNVDAYFNYLNCSSADIVDSMSCLRNESAFDIQNTVDTALAPYGGFSPLIDGDFVRGHAEKILESTESEEYQFFTSIDYMVGSLNGDGAVVIPGFIPPSVQKSFNFSVQDGFSSSVLTMYLSGFFASYHQNKSSVKERIDDLYKTNVSDAQQGNLIVDFLTDFGFTFPALMSADFHYLRSISRNKSKTFVYHMTRISSIQSIVYPGWTYPWLQRLTHGMDVLFLFNTSVFAGNQEDLDLARQMLTYWTNFAKKR
ncbi:hypothetical protein FSP39_021165 [Pinctada imbricata]|uniref:Carboxylic ester hydrolase n=1 Tax=Pinctada imbricata TaxID=66713 RepID=A0AA89C1S3_PINIB|nr:hypothetical protein FSP39_021165 [Pinctada imbricata]